MIFGVEQTDDRMAYRVRSDRVAVKPWRVDLEQFDGWGACDCPDYCLPRNRQPSKRDRMRSGERSEAVMCKHIRRAHVAHSIYLNQRILAAAGKGPKHKSEAWRNEA